MKLWLIGLALLFALVGRSQSKLSFPAVDWKAGLLDAPTPDSLGRLIGATFSTTAEKTRAVYSWITDRIAYNTAIFKPWAKFSYSPDPLDTAAAWPSGDEMAARKVMRRRVAVCDGYARLFKVVCQYAGVEAEVVQGYGRAPGRGDGKFRTNHTWNAVKIDSVWFLLDATWASGFLDAADNFVQKKNDFYYLTPPEDFIYDHYPEDLRWTLLPAPPVPGEFRRMPFRSKNFYRYNIGTHSPDNGIVEAAIGDTLRFSLQLKDWERVKKIGADPFADTAAYTAWPQSAFLKPSKEKAALVEYLYAVQPGVEWVHLLYNGDVVLHYRLKPKEVSAAK